MTHVPNDPLISDDQTLDPARLSLLGHDLRAAVSDIIGGLRLIDQSGLDGGTRLQLERVRAAGEVLARLLEQELSMMQGEQGFADAPVSNVHLPRLLHDLEMRWSGRAQEKGLSFSVSVADGVPKVLALDRIALERVMSNILSNAVKYTDEGKVGLSVAMNELGTLQLCVRDDGPGFSAEAMDGLLRNTGQRDGRGKPGLGLGMQIAKDMTNRLGGRMDVSNDTGGGAVVTVLLPADVWTPCRIENGHAEDPTENDHGTGAALPDLSKVKVLLADDSLTNQAVIGSMLTSLGAEYEVASDGVEAMHWLDRERFDLVLLDIEMPRMSGLEVMRALRRQTGPQAKMPILAITAYVLRANREAIYAAGADGLLAKPVMSIEAFGLAIERSLSRRPVRNPVADPLPPSQTAETLSDFDHDRFARLMEIAGPLAGTELLARLETDLRQVERGLIAATADHTVPTAALAEIRAQTHVLIALAGAVGATRLQKLAEVMNGAAHHANHMAVRLQGAQLLAALDQLIHFVSQERTTRQNTS